MRKSILCLLTTVCFSDAIVVCEDLDRYQNDVGDLTIEEQIDFVYIASKYANYLECMAEGEGSSFWSSDALLVKKCDGKSNSKKGYVQFTVTCNACTAEWIIEELKQIESDCREECRESNYACPPPSLPKQWGGEIKKINPNGGVCGSPLPNCSESSSSETIESSSSEEISSSSKESSSSMGESSSSIEQLSSSEEIDSSSSENDDDESSSSSDESSSSFDVLMDHCEIGGDKKDSLLRMGFVHTDIYSDYPYLSNRDDVSLWDCYCMGSNYVACDFLNFGLVEGYSPIEMPICGYPEGYWCDGIESGSCNYGGKSVRLYYTDKYGPGEVAWSAIAFGETDYIMPIENTSMRIFVREYGNGVEHITNLFSMRYLLPANVSYQDLENIVLEAVPQFPDMDKLVAYCRGEWVPHDEECFGTLDEVNFALLDSSDNCAITYGIPHYEISYSNRGWCVDGECEPAEPYSSVVEESSSSIEESSSSVDESSSSEYLSSSVDDVYSSSSMEASSSTVLPESSSAGVAAEPFIAGADQEYSPDQIFNSGLQNMEPGACYSLNSERGVQHGWINTNAQDSYWWRESDCNTGERVDRNKIGQCSGFPIGYTPDHPDQTCFAHNGKCYRCMAEKSYVDCSQNWVWKWNFNANLVNDWYAEVDCNNPSFGNGGLYKKARKLDEPIENSDYSVDFRPARRFDVMGRRNSIRNAVRNKKVLYKKF